MVCLWSHPGLVTICNDGSEADCGLDLVKVCSSERCFGFLELPMMTGGADGAADSWRGRGRCSVSEWLSALMLFRLLRTQGRRRSGLRRGAARRPEGALYFMQTRSSPLTRMELLLLLRHLQVGNKGILLLRRRLWIFHQGGRNGGENPPWGCSGCASGSPSNDDEVEEAAESSGADGCSGLPNASDSHIYL